VVSLAAGKLVPSISHQARWPYAVLGTGFGLLGLVFIAYGLRRAREVRGAVARAEFQHPDDRILALLTGVGVALALLLLVLVAIQT
jgi:hypothetical protein